MVKEILRRSGLSQSELARRAGMPRSVVSVYVNGHREPGAVTLARLASAGGLQLELGRRKAAVDPHRAGRILVEVLELAEALPFKPKPDLSYPRLAERFAEAGAKSAS
jgi:transcriptional regulator with XRE-family HTH domain